VVWESFFGLLFGKSIFTFLLTPFPKCCGSLYTRVKAHETYWLYHFILLATFLYDFGQIFYAYHKFFSLQMQNCILISSLVLFCCTASISYCYNFSWKTLFLLRMFALSAFRVWIMLYLNTRY